MSDLKCASFFAGVGGIDFAFKKHGLETVYANEIDLNPAITFEKNFNLKVDVRDIKNVNSQEIPDFDIMLAGFPCQAFSVAGYRQGFNDEKGRGVLFFELERIFREKLPQVIFLENVKNLVSHDGGNTFKTIVEKLENAGYYVKYKVLNAMYYGNIPQNRERIYIAGFRDINAYYHFDFPYPCELTKKISDIADFNSKKDDKYYYTEKCAFYNILKKDINKRDTVYQWRRKYVRENKNKVCPTLTANMGGGGHNVPLILTKYGIRKLTPLECFKFQGFPENFKIPENMSDTKAYMQAGNSVCVTVIERIAENIIKALNN